MADGSESVISGIIILFIPLLLAIPVSFAWKWWIGIEPEHEHYREKVRRVLDSGIPLSRYRSELDAEAIKVEILSDRQARIESDLIHPLRLYHFLLFPSLILWPPLPIALLTSSGFNITSTLMFSSSIFIEFILAGFKDLEI